MRSPAALRAARLLGADDAKLGPSAKSRRFEADLFSETFAKAHANDVRERTITERLCERYKAGTVVDEHTAALAAREVLIEARTEHRRHLAVDVAVHQLLDLAAAHPVAFEEGDLVIIHTEQSPAFAKH